MYFSPARMALAVLAAVILSPAVTKAADDLEGQASVIEGDTLEIHGTRIRLCGIDAPESSQLCRGEDRPWPRCAMVRSAKSSIDPQAVALSRSARFRWKRFSTWRPAT
jgi:endonuclease YncB( thermonuclease family)